MGRFLPVAEGTSRPKAAGRFGLENRSVPLSQFLSAEFS
jgi:hypothetical protein